MIDWARGHKFLVLLFFTGCLLRLILPGNMEYKYDEMLMFHFSQRMVDTGSWEWLGMQSGAGIRNPGVSMWLFGVFALVAKTPIAMMSCVAITNILALFLWLTFVFRKIPGDERETWLWGIVLAAVSPLAILFSRKIWAQDILPFFTFLTLLGLFNRDKFWGGIVWGFFGAILGQIHMSGFFFALGLFVVTALLDYKSQNNTKWLAWFVGSALGLFLLIPWIIHVLDVGGAQNLALINVLVPKFYYFFVNDAFGIGLEYSMGREFIKFLMGPYIGDVPTLLVGFLHAILFFYLVKTIFQLPILITGAYTKFITFKWSFLDQVLFGILFGLGICMTLSGIRVHPHYLIIASPFMYL
jgi:hypothetical protein